MPRIPPLDNDAAPPEARVAAEAHVRNHARMTNMKRTLLHSLPAFRALMEWYPLRDTIQPFLGERLTTLFAHAISAETDCLICSTFFRRMLIQTGDNPDRLKLALPLATSVRHNAQQIAWNHIGRRAITGDPNWRKSNSVFKPMNTS